VFNSFLHDYLDMNDWKLSPDEYVMQQLEIQDFPDENPQEFYEEFWRLGVIGTPLGDAFDEWFEDNEHSFVEKEKPVKKLKKISMPTRQEHDEDRQRAINEGTEADIEQVKKLKKLKKMKKLKKQKKISMPTRQEHDEDRQRAINEETEADIEQLRAKIAATHMRQTRTAAQMTLKELSPFGPLLTRIDSYKADLRSKITITGTAAEADSFQKKLIASLNVL
jgi:hypothetical protein